MLLVKELKKVICSVSYLLFVAILFLGLYSQGVFHFGDRAVEEPRPVSYTHLTLPTILLV